MSKDTWAPKQAWGRPCGQREAPVNGLSLLSQVGQNHRPQNGPSWGWKALKPQADTICFPEQDTKAQSDEARGWEHSRVSESEGSRQHQGASYTF